MKIPEVSVVMCVYNGAANLDISISSIISQKGCNFEFIVVNDGSSDASGQMLDQWAAQDTRLRVIHQDNTGLTRALIRGCAEARGEFIARQDCGDVSLPGRLALQVEYLRQDAEAVAISCHTRFIGPRDEILYQVDISEATLADGLKTVSKNIHGPSHHGSVMFRKNSYVTTGGYRKHFYYAQDLDLWTRLIELGRFSVISQVLYMARIEPQAISGTSRYEQIQLTKLIMKATQARRSGLSEISYIKAAEKIKRINYVDLSYRIALGNYFIGCCLRKNDVRAAEYYFRQAMKNDPWLLRARIRWIQTQLVGASR